MQAIAHTIARGSKWMADIGVTHDKQAVPVAGLAEAAAACRAGRSDEALGIWEALRATATAPLAAWLDAVDWLAVQGRHAEAEALSVQAQQHFPADPAPLLKFARLAEARREWEEALRRFRAVRERFPGDTWGAIGEVGCLRELDRLDEAEQVIAEAEQRFPNDPVLLLERTRLAARRRNWSEALRWNDQLRTQFPEISWGYTGAAQALQELGRMAEADAVLAEAATRFPHDAGFVRTAAGLALQLGAVDRAVQLYTAARERLPNDLAVLRGLAEAYRRSGNMQQAEAVLLEAILQFPTDPVPILEYSRLAEGGREWEEALRRFRVVRKRFPDNNWGAIGQIGCLRELDRLDEAEQVIAEAEQRFHNDPVLLLERTRLADRRRNWSEALRWNDALRTRFPAISWGYTGAAHALQELGRLDEADALLSEAVARFPHDIGIVHAAGNIALHRGAFDQALHVYTAAHGRFPDDLGVMRGLAEAYRRCGEMQKATELLDGSIERWPHDISNLVARLRVAADTKDWDTCLRLSQAFRDAHPSSVEMFNLRRIRIDALVETGAMSEAAAEFETLAQSSDGNPDLLAPATNIALRLSDLNWVRRVWGYILTIQQVDANRLGFATVDIYRSFYRQPGSEFLVQWIFTQRAPGRADWFPAGVFPLHTLLTYHATGPERREPGASTLRYPDARIHLGKAYATADQSKVNPLVRALLGPWTGDAPSHLEYVNLMMEILRKTTEEVWPRRVFLNLLWVIGYFTGAGTRREAAVTRMVEGLVSSGEFLCRKHAPGLLLLLMGADTVAKSAYRLILDMLRRNDVWLPSEPDYSTPTGLLRNMLSRSFDRVVPFIVSAPRQLRLAIEVSGHLRGYKAARKSWRNLRFADHDLQIVVYCARKLGHKPSSDGGYVRTFKPHMAAAVGAIVAQRGWAFVENQYGDLMRELDAPGETIVTEQEVREFYGAKAAIVVDEEQPEFTSRDRVWRMYRGMYMAHQLAIKALPECDLYVRMRPDYEFREELKADWWDMFVRSHRDRVIFSERGRVVNDQPEFFMGDQFAIGSREVMGSYARAFLDVERSRTGQFFGYSKLWLAHENVALSTFYDGIAIEPLHEIGADRMLNTPIRPAVEVFQILMRQIGGQPRHEEDVRLLEANQADQRAEMDGPQ